VAHPASERSALARSEPKANEVRVARLPGQPTPLRISLLRISNFPTCAARPASERSALARSEPKANEVRVARLRRAGPR